MFGMGTGVAPPLWSPGNIYIATLYVVHAAAGKTGGSPASGSDTEPGRGRLHRGIYSASLSGCGRMNKKYGQASREISTGQLNTLPHLHCQPINQIISLVSSVFSKNKGYLILRGASRLDAFSSYPFRTWLPSTYPWQDNWYTRGSSIPVLSY